MKANRTQYQKNWVAAARAWRNSHVNQVDGNWDESANNEHDTFSDSDDLANDMELTGHEEHFCQEEDISFISSDFKNEWAEWHIDDDLSDTLDDQSLDGFLEDRLWCWENDFQIKQNALDSLLKILKKSGHPTLPTLPSSARTLMKTARVVQIQQKSGMEYKYFPIARGVKKTQVYRQNFGKSRTLLTKLRIR